MTPMTGKNSYSSTVICSHYGLMNGGDSYKKAKWSKLFIVNATKLG
jgi:hypothetical protein